MMENTLLEIQREKESLLAVAVSIRLLNNF